MELVIKEIKSTLEDVVSIMAIEKERKTKYVSEEIVIETLRNIQGKL